MGKIQILPPDLINQIAAGEVVERPASVVKELVENALDAGSTRIDIAVSEGGRAIRIADNGSGMGADDLQVAFQNHATSKLRTSEDLFRLSSLGFRGEALASVAAISKLVCSSRTAESDHGLKAIVSASGAVTLQQTGCAVGTVMDVQDLFYNVPARLKFLKRPQTELAHIQEMAQMLALSHPEVAFQLKLEESVALKTSGSGDVLKAIGEVFSLGDHETLVRFEKRDEEFGYRAWGYTGLPQVTRSAKKWMMTFLNQRAIRCPILMKAIESAYQSLMTPGKYPVTVLFLEIPPDEVDVNVHPTKREVKYQRANAMFSFVRAGIEQKLSEQLVVSAPERTMASVGASYSQSSSARPAWTPHAASPPTNAARPRFESASPMPTQAALQIYSPLPEGLSSDTPRPQAEIPAFRVLGQLAKTYILVETEDGMMIVDQHIASERVNFERLKDLAEQVQPASQALLVPITHPVSPAQADQLEANRDTLEEIGFVFTLEADQVVFTSVPILYNDGVLKERLDALLSDLEHPEKAAELTADDVIATASCHSAVRAGDTLNHLQMERVVHQWLACTRPWTCPHGRPVSRLLTHKEIMAFFERPSLPVR